MDAGQKVYRAYICQTPGDYWIDTGTITDLAVNGVPLVRMNGEVMVPLNDMWRETKAHAKADAAAGIARKIGAVQVKLDELRAEILHDDLTTEEVHHGVA
jgi:hypothetical protein